MHFYCPRCHESLIMVDPILVIINIYYIFSSMPVSREDFQDNDVFSLHYILYAQSLAQEQLPRGS